MIEISELLKEGDAVKIAAYVKNNDLEIQNGKIMVVEGKTEWVKAQILFWDQRQQAR